MRGEVEVDLGHELAGEGREPVTVPWGPHWFVASPGERCGWVGQERLCDDLDGPPELRGAASGVVDRRREHEGRDEVGGGSLVKELLRDCELRAGGSLEELCEVRRPHPAAKFAVPVSVLNEDGCASGLGEAIEGGGDVGGPRDDDRRGYLVLVAKGGADEVGQVLRPADAGIIQVGDGDLGAHPRVKHVVVGVWDAFV